MAAAHIIIDKEFSKRLRPLSADELAKLEAGIQANGCIKPLVIWHPHNILLDGHHRYKLCQKHGLGFRVVNVKLPDREAALKWIDDHQGGQRNEPTEYAKAEETIEAKGEDIAEKATKRKKAGKSPKSPSSESQPGKTFGHTVSEGRAREQLAKEAGVSEATIQRTKAVMERGSEELKQQLRDGTVSLNAAYKQVMADAKDDKETEPEPEPEPPSDPTDRLGNVLPDTPHIREAFARDKEVTALMSAVSKLKGEIKAVAAADPKDPIWSRFDIGNAFADLDHVRALLKRARPHGLCPYCKGGERGGGKNCTACDGRGWMDEYNYAMSPKELR